MTIIDWAKTLDALDWGGIAAGIGAVLNIFTARSRVADTLVRVAASLHSLTPSLASLYRDWTEPLDAVRERHKFGKPANSTDQPKMLDMGPR